MPKIVSITLNPCVDKSTSVETVASEIKLRCDEPTYDPGGGGINASRAIKKLGGESVAVFTSGGAVGKRLESLLRQESLSIKPVAVIQETRENMIVFERSTTLQFRFGMPGGRLENHEIEACVEAVLAEDADYIVGSGSLPPNVPDDFYVQLASRASKKAKLIVDTSGKALEKLIGTGVYLLKPNIHELEILSGETFNGEEQMITATQRLIEQKMAEVFVISLGAQGAALITAQEVVHFRPPTVRIRSKVGAGDSMVGGITYRLAQGADLIDAVRYGIASGTAAVMNSGTQLCRKEDVETIYPRVKVIVE
jgi:6-phosphofructokinase 2